MNDSREHSKPQGQELTWSDTKWQQPSPFVLNEGSYHRSKIFHSEYGVNPLLQVAAPLFSLANYLKNSEEPEDVPLLLQNIIHEVRAFEDKAKSYNYSSNLVLASRYVLCAFLDEIVLQNNWGVSNNWHQDNLLNFFYGEVDADKQFFVIVEKALPDPKNSLDLLELIYLVLSLGFQGDTKNENHGEVNLGQLSADIYDVIRSQRGEFSKGLLVEAKSSQQLKQLATEPSPKWWTRRWLVSGMGVLILVGIYVGLSWHLHHLLQASAAG